MPLFRLRGSRVRAVSSQSRVRIMFRMPKKPAVERRPILRSMIKVDVDDMPRKLVEKPIPVTVAAPGELPYGAVDHIELIVVMGDQRGGTARTNTSKIGMKGRQRGSSREAGQLQGRHKGRKNYPSRTRL